MTESQESDSQEEKSVESCTLLGALRRLEEGIQALSYKFVWATLDENESKVLLDHVEALTAERNKRVEAEKKYREAGLAYDERGDELFELKKQLAQANAKIRELEKGIK